MKRTLQLTSPLMHGPDVEYARRLLHVTAGSKFDETAAAACRSIKWTLGYAENACTPTFGTALEKLLTNRADPSMLMRKRAADRAKHGAAGRLAVDEAMRWVGITERPPGTNICKPFTEWYGWHGWGAAWCAVFVSYCLDKGGFEPVSPRDQRWAYCPYIVRDATHGKYGLALCSEREVAKGTIALFDWDNDGVADHVGLCREPVDLRAGTVATVEGNTSAGRSGSQSNGGGVYARTRDLTDIIAFVALTV